MLKLTFITTKSSPSTWTNTSTIKSIAVIEFAAAIVLAVFTVEASRTCCQQYNSHHQLVINTLNKMQSKSIDVLSTYCQSSQKYNCSCQSYDHTLHHFDINIHVPCKHLSWHVNPAPHIHTINKQICIMQYHCSTSNS